MTAIPETRKCKSCKHELREFDRKLEVANLFQSPNFAKISFNFKLAVAIRKSQFILLNVQTAGHSGTVTHHPYELP